MYFLQAVITIWQRELVRYLRDKTRIFLTLFQPLMFFTIFGTGLRKTFEMSDLGVDSITFMFPGIIAMSVMGVAFYSSVSTIWDREFGFLKEILVAPVSRTAIILGKTFGSATMATVQAIVLLIIAPFVGIKLSLIILPKLFIFMVMLSFAIAGIGLFIASIIKTIENFGIIMNVLVFPMFFLSGAFFPIKDVPLWMQVFTKINPLAYGVDAFRQLMMPVNAITANLAIHSLYFNAAYLISFAIVMILAAVITFNKRIY